MRGDSTPPRRVHPDVRPRPHPRRRDPIPSHGGAGGGDEAYNDRDKREQPTTSHPRTTEVGQPREAHQVRERPYTDSKYTGAWTAQRPSP